MPEIVTGMVALIAKSVGSVLGSLMALVFMPPTTRWEALRRFLFAWVAGAVFSPVVIDHLHYARTFETFVSASAAVALVSWWLTGAIVRISRSWTPPK